MIGLRWQYMAAQAARSGDPVAFDIVWRHFRVPLRAVVRRTLRDMDESAAEEAVTEVLDRARACSFRELKEKPGDWSTYGWMSWVAQREAAGATLSRSYPME